MGAEPSAAARMRRRGIALAVALVAACSSGAPAVAPSTGPAATAPSTEPGERTFAATAAPAATPEPGLPGGLEQRIGRPALVNGEAAACIPTCGRGRVAGGVLPMGRYQTEWFFGGYMTLQSDGTWPRTEDSDGELSLPLSGTGDDVYRLAFFLDPSLVVDDKPQDVVRSAADYVAWFDDHPDLLVGKPIETRIGALPATAIDVRLAAAAPHQYADCPAACVSFLKVAAFDHSDGILGNDEYRLVFADVSYSGSDHLLVVKVEGRDVDDLLAQLPRVNGLLANVTVPAHAGHNGS